MNIDYFSFELNMQAAQEKAAALETVISAGIKTCIAPSFLCIESRWNHHSVYQRVD